MKKIKNGFTLIEIIGIIILLGVIGLLVYPTIMRIIGDSKEDLYKKNVSEIERLAANWASLNESKLPTMDEMGYYIKIEVLKNEGFIEEDIINPKTEEPMLGCVGITYDKPKDKYTYKYYDDCSSFVKPTLSKFNASIAENEYGWRNKDFYVTLESEYLDYYDYCIGDNKCEPNIRMNNASEKILINQEGIKYVCAKGTNKVGITAIECMLYRLDKTKPNVGKIIFSGTTGLDNWFVSDVAVTTTKSTDNLSGIASNTLSPNVTKITVDTKGTTYTLTARDLAGNESSASYAVKVDKTKPIVGELVVASGTLGTNGWYTSNVVFSVKNGSDALSGHGSTTSSISSITTNTKGTNVVVTTKDKAGNSTAKTYTFKVDKNAPTITPKYSTVTIGSISEVNVSDLFIINYSTSGGSIKCNVAKTSNIKGVNNPLKCTATGGNGLTASASIIVKNPLVSIAVTKNPNKMEYRLGDAFDKTGMVVTATYKDGKTRAVTNYTLSMETRESDSRGNKRDGGYGLNYLYPERNDKKNIIDISYTEDSVTATTNIGINTYIYPDQVVKYYVVASYYDIYDISDINWSNPPHYFGIYGDYRSYDNDYSNTTYGCKYTVGSNYLLSTSTNKNYMCTLKYDFYTLITDGSYWDSGYYEKDRNYILTRTNNVGYSSGTAIWLSDIDNNASADSQNVTLTVDELRPTWYMGVACNRGTCTIRHTMNSLKVSGKSYPIVVEAGF